MPYLNVDETNSLLELLTLQFPGRCERIQLPEQTSEGRSCFALRVKVGAEENRPAILLLGNVHGEEWGSTDILMSLAQRLLDASAHGSSLQIGSLSMSAAEVSEMLNRTEILFFPIVNPDGKAFSQTSDSTWRKNRRPAADPEEIGVDVNRNFDWLWDISTVFDPNALPFLVVSEDPTSFTYHGAAPFSEPESRNVRHLLDANPRIRFLIDVHCFSGYVMHPWGDDDRQTADRFQSFKNPAFNARRGIVGDTAYAEYSTARDLVRHQDLVHRMASAIAGIRGSAYTEGPISTTMYQVCGDTADYAYSRHRADRSLPKIDGFLIEWGIGSGFQPPFAEMQVIIQEISAGLLSLLRAAQDQPFIEKQPDPALFGRVAVGESRAVTIQIRNASTRPVRIENVHVEGGPGYSTHPPPNTLLTPGAAETIAVVLSPQVEGPARGALVFDARFEELVIGQGLVRGRTFDAVEVELQGGSCVPRRGECLAPTFPPHGPAACATIRATCGLLIALMKLFGGGRFRCAVAQLQFRIDHCAEGNGDPCIQLLPGLRGVLPGRRP